MAERGAADLRADAVRNRERLLEAARLTFAEQGLDASMRQIARRAGVSEPTLRRRFGSKQELVAAAFSDKVSMYADHAAAGLEASDPWEGFCGFVHNMAHMQLVDRGFAEVLALTFPISMRYEQERRRAYDDVEALITRAQDAGKLREDFVPEDVVMLLLAHAGVAVVSGEVAERMSGRLLAYLLEAFSAPGSTDLPLPPTVAQTYRALLTLNRA
ncbi:TetR/AcrR family transcriptional regulator [Oerskovia enterophila]